MIAPVRQFGAVWLFPLTYALHLCEEYFVAGGFPMWAQRTLQLCFTNSEFVGWNAFALGLMSLGAWLVSRESRFRFIEIALAVAVLGNVIAHVLGSVVTQTYSPGLITGVFVWLPLGVVRLRTARRASTPRAHIAGTYLGVAVVLVSLSLVALGFFCDRRIISLPPNTLNQSHPLVTRRSLNSLTLSSQVDRRQRSGDPTGDSDRPRGSFRRVAAIRPGDAHLRVGRRYSVDDPAGA